MAKRYTNKEQWKQQWYRELGSKGRDIYHYILDNADYVGVWDIDLPLMSFQLGFELSLDDVFKVFKNKVVELDSKLFFEEYLKSQYSHVNVGDPMYRNIIKKLKYHGLSPDSLMLLAQCPTRPVADSQAKAKTKAKEEAEAYTYAEAKEEAEAKTETEAIENESSTNDGPSEAELNFRSRFGRKDRMYKV